MIVISKKDKLENNVYYCPCCGFKVIYDKMKVCPLCNELIKWVK